MIQNDGEMARLESTRICSYEELATRQSMKVLTATALFLAGRLDTESKALLAIVHREIASRAP